jgi:hypothetical protein
MNLNYMQLHDGFGLESQLNKLNNSIVPKPWQDPTLKVSALPTPRKKGYTIKTWKFLMKAESAMCTKTVVILTMNS